MSGYQLFEIAVVTVAVLYSAWRVWQRYLRPAPVAAAAPAGAAVGGEAAGCNSCGAKTGCSKPD